MKFLNILCIVLLCLTGLISASIDNEQDFKIYDISTKNAFEKQLLLRLQDQDDFDFFNLPRALNEAARMRVPLKNSTDLEQLLSHFDIEFKEVPHNDKIELFAAGRVAKEPSKFVSFTKFQRAAAINTYLDTLAKKYAKRVSVKTVGQSYEGRDLKVITVSNGDGKKNKKVILLDGGIHAREWIAPAGVLYVIYQLVENYAENADLLKDYDWVILPLINPDGYEYSHTDNRMWRKTRQPHRFYCTGTDANRNFGFHWGEVGASNSCYADTYKGAKAFSEPETEALRQLMHEYSDRAKFYLTLHAYGNYLLYPWGFQSKLPENWREIDAVAKKGAAAIKAATGTEYTVGSSTNVLYAAAGGSDDYALGVVGIPISITMELPAGGSGFNPSASQILPMVTETWVGIRAMAKAVVQKY